MTQEQCDFEKASIKSHIRLQVHQFYIHPFKEVSKELLLTLQLSKETTMEKENEFTLPVTLKQDSLLTLGLSQRRKQYLPSQTNFQSTTQMCFKG
jgi:hypothetical protein